MTPVEILTLAADAARYDAVVFLWATSRGTQPVLLPRSLGTAPQRRPASTRPVVSGGSAGRRDR
ncbi:MAG: hypothetical protein ACXWWR_03705 [Candidatus Limnocylindrales bacterium]